MSSISVRHRAEMPEIGPMSYAENGPMSYAEIGPMSYAEIGPMSVPRWPRSGRYWANIVWLSGYYLLLSDLTMKTITNSAAEEFAVFQVVSSSAGVVLL